jgi:hypothetical protein
LNRIQLLSKKDLTVKDWVILTKDVANKMTSQFISYSLIPIKELKVLSDTPTQSFISRINPELIEFQGQVDYDTQGLFQRVYHQYGNRPNGTKSKTWYYGVTRSTSWVIIDVDYTYIDGGHGKIDKIIIRESHLEEIISNLNEDDRSMVRDFLIQNLTIWHKRSKERTEELEVLLNKFNQDTRLMQYMAPDE